MTATSRPGALAVLFDIDGTLVDSNDAHARAWVAALAEHGHTVPFDRVRSYIGMGSDKLLIAVAGIDSESDEGQRIAAKRKELFNRSIPSLRATRGARTLLQHLKDGGMRLAIATSADQDEANRLLDLANVADLVARPARRSRQRPTKPDPDVVQEALAQAGVDAADALLVGDTPYDVEAARRSGLPTIALRCGGWWSDAALAGAVAIYDDPEDLDAHIAESALGRRRVRTVVP